MKLSSGIICNQQCRSIMSQNLANPYFFLSWAGSVNKFGGEVESGGQPQTLRTLKFRQRNRHEEGRKEARKTDRQADRQKKKELKKKKNYNKRKEQKKKKNETGVGGRSFLKLDSTRVW